MRKMYKVALFASHEPGLEILKFLKEQNNLKICNLYLTGKNKKIDKKLRTLSGLHNNNIFIEKSSYENEKHYKLFKKSNIDCLITVFWPWIISRKLFSHSKKTINFHPSFLPSYRGWYPHVHNIIDKTQSGVTLHELDDTADSGRIWIQKKIKTETTDNAKDLYDRLQKEIVKLFKENWDKIRNNKIKPFNQSNINTSFKTKKDVQKYDFIETDKKFAAKDLINILRARNFGDKSYAYFVENGRKVFIKLSLTH